MTERKNVYEAMIIFDSNRYARERAGLPAEIEKMIQAGDLMTGAGSVKTADVITPYVEEISGQFNWKRRIKVVFDAGNGAAGPAMHRLIERLNCDAVELFFEPDGHFPCHHPDPTVEENLEQLKEAVHKHGADLGLGRSVTPSPLADIDSLSPRWAKFEQCRVGQVVIDNHICFSQSALSANPLDG